MKNDLLITCIQTFSWCTKAHSVVVEHKKSIGMTHPTPPSSVELSTLVSSSISKASNKNKTNENILTVEYIQNLLKEGNLLETNSNEVIRKFSEHSLKILNDEDNSHENLITGCNFEILNSRKYSDKGLTTTYKKLCQDDITRAEYGETLCFELVEFWRQKLIVILLEISK